jgi:3-oxoacyl-[acyl-carrier protein] reductase
MFLIIGASSDVGNEIVKDLIKYDDVLLTYRNKNNIKKIKPNKYRIFYEKLDLTDYKNIDKFLKKYSKLLKNIKFINLATAKSDKIIINLNTIDIQNVFKVNVLSNIYLCKKLLPLMIQQKFGRFIFLTSKRASRGDVGISLYSSSKEAISGFSKCLAKEYYDYNITSNCIKMGYFKTKLFEKIPKKIQLKLISQIPNKKLGNLRNINNVIHAIVDSEYINGSTIDVDGGI